MSATEQILKKDPTLEIHNEGEWSHTNSEYAAFNDAGVECETGEFLYGLIRALKPKECLETGTHWGIGASYIGVALQANGHGILETHEFLQENYLKARERLHKLNLLDSVVFPNLIDTSKYDPSDRKYDLILLDTEPQTRFAELLKYYPYLNEGGFVFIHDLHRHMHQIENTEHGFAWPFGQVPQGIKDLVKSDKLRPFHLPTPRGLTGFYKVSADDYKWEK